MSGVERLPSPDGGISHPLPPPQQPGGSVHPDRGGASPAPLTPNSSPLPRNLRPGGRAVSDETITLVVPRGAELAPISYGDREFLPYRENGERTGRWLVDVHAEAAVALCRMGGFERLR